MPWRLADEEHRHRPGWTRGLDATASRIYAYGGLDNVFNPGGGDFRVAQPVFLSYARQASKEFAQQLYAKLGPEQAFLDTEAIEHGDRFPGTLADAVLGARVVVIFGNGRITLTPPARLE